MGAHLECCVLGCYAKPNQGLHFYRFPCHNPQISSIWEQRICQSVKTDFDILNDYVCELHFDYRCKTGNECALEEGSLPTLYLPGCSNIFSAGNAHFQMSADRIEESSYTISIDTLSYHCRFCLRRGLLYEVEASTYRSKSFSSLIDLPRNVLRDSSHPNACLACIKSIVIAHKLSMAVEHSNAILQQLLQHPKQSIVVSNTNYFDIKSELAFCNLIVANSLTIKLEIEFEDSMVCGNEYEPKWVVAEEPTTATAYGNSKNIIEKSICVTEKQDNVSKMHDSSTLDKQCQKEFNNSFTIDAIGENMVDLSAEGISNAIENESCVLMEYTHHKAEVMVSNYSNDSCEQDRQFDNEQSPELNKAVYEPTYKCDLCRFSTNYKASLAIHKNLHLAGNAKEQFYCRKCEKDFLLRRHFLRHSAIVHAVDFICKICDKPHASATKLAVHYTEHHHFQCDISSRVLGSGHRVHMLDHTQGMTTFTTIDYNICPICEWKTPSPNSFNEHMDKHEQSDKYCTIGSQEFETLNTDAVQNADCRYQCTECPKAFRNECAFIRHVRIHSNERPYKCTKCSKAFSQKCSLDIHQRIHTNERPYKCTECQKTFNRKSTFNTHRRMHTNETPYKCTECPKTYMNKSAFNTHKRIHANERPYKCTECPKTFNNKSSFNTHGRIHTNERPYVCSECPKSFSDNSSLIRHKRMHTNERPYKCTECPKAFSQKCSLDIHQRIHTNERPYVCTECPKSFSDKSCLRRHKIIHTNERPYKCKECPKAFSQKCSLHIHQRIHRNEKPYVCTECPKSFRQKGDLDKHKRIHTNERPYKCTECPKAFTQKCGLNIHERVHMNERPYVCTECPKSFRQKGGLDKHKRIHTNE